MTNRGLTSIGFFLDDRAKLRVIDGLLALHRASKLGVVYVDADRIRIAEPAVGDGSSVLTSGGFILRKMSWREAAELTGELNSKLAD